ncbi:MAG: hypothetical protein ACE5HJ_07400 [Thermoplasmata archaeon]
MMRSLASALAILLGLSALLLPVSAAPVEGTVVIGDFETGSLSPWTENFAEQIPEICVWMCGEIHTEVHPRVSGNPGTGSYVLHTRYGGQSGGHTGVRLIRDLSSLDISLDRAHKLSFYIQTNVNPCGTDCWRIVQVFLTYTRPDGSLGGELWSRYWWFDGSPTSCRDWCFKEFGAEGVFEFDLTAIIPEADRNQETFLTEIHLIHAYKSFGASSTEPLETFWDDIRFTVASATVGANINIDPDTLNLRSRGRFITAYIEIPDHDLSQVDIGSVMLSDGVGEVPAVSDPDFGFVKDPEIRDRDGDGLPELIVKFSREAVKEVVTTGWNTLTVSGTVNGLPFEGSDTIRAIGSGR